MWDGDLSQMGLDVFFVVMVVWLCMILARIIRHYMWIADS